MKINWKLRVKNKVTFMAIIMAGLSIVYKVLEILHVVPPVAMQELVSLAELVATFLVVIGVLVDPTTEGASDSVQAMQYTTPKPKKKEDER